MQKKSFSLGSAFSSWKHEVEWPFMLFLTFVFAFIYVWTVATSERLHDPALLVVFTILFNIHLGLHWASIVWLKRKWNIWLYLLIQSTIVFVLVSLAGVIGALLGLYLGLVGEAAGLFSASWWKKALAVAVILALSAVNYYAVMRGSDFVWWAVAILPMTFFVIIYVLLYSRQADARVKAQELLAELETANRRLTEYADRIEELTLADERQRMARELHDTLAQGLAGLVLQLEAADSHLSAGRPERAQEIVRQAMTRARATLAESRRAIDGLRKELPVSLEEAVQSEVRHFQSAAGVPCETDISLAGPMPGEIQELFLRAVSESLTNIAKHAHAGRAAVKLRGGAGKFEMEVKDNGVGFDAAGEEEHAGHYGLIGLRERVRQAGGALEIQSAEGKGTSVKIVIPNGR